MKLKDCKEKREKFVRECDKKQTRCVDSFIRESIIIFVEEK